MFKSGAGNGFSRHGYDLNNNLIKRFKSECGEEKIEGFKNDKKNIAHFNMN
ncbi:peptidyl-tRNA hydrolase [Psychrobacter sp. 1501(2011)]|nr:peptidyl-tRNA hydrolase [Psychrobacter sp. 1501(2011)]